MQTAVSSTEMLISFGEPEELLQLNRVRGNWGGLAGCTVGTPSSAPPSWALDSVIALVRDHGD